MKKALALLLLLAGCTEPALTPAPPTLSGDVAILTMESALKTSVASYPTLTPWIITATAQPTATPSASPTARPTATASHTPTPAPSQTAWIVTASPGPTWTAQPTQTAWIITATPRPTWTPSPSPTPSASPTARPTASPAPSQTAWIVTATIAPTLDRFHKGVSYLDLLRADCESRYITIVGDSHGVNYYYDPLLEVCYTGGLRIP